MRVSKKVTTTTPIRLGTAEISRREICRIIDRPKPSPARGSTPRSGGMGCVSTRQLYLGFPKRRHLAIETHPIPRRRRRGLPRAGEERGGAATRSSPLHELAIVELAVEPVAIARDVLLHRHIEQRLKQR